MNITIDSNQITDAIKKAVQTYVTKHHVNDGITLGINDFRKKYCGGKSPEWVRTFIFDEFPEIDYENGGFVINPRRSEYGRKTIIFEKPASEWMEKNRRRIDWEARL